MSNLARIRTASFLSIIGLALALAFVSCRASEKPPASTTKPQLGHLEILTGGAHEKDTLPMVVGIHGLGDRPGSFSGLYEELPVKTRIILPVGPDEWGPGFSWFEIKIPYSSNQEAMASGIERSADRIADLIRALVKELPTRGKPIISGFSQGGMLSFAVATRHPDLVSMAIPIGGALPPSLIPAKKPSTGFPPIRAMNGTDDQKVPFELARETVDALKKLGADASMNEYPGVGHTITGGMRGRMYRLIGEASP